MWKFIFGEEKSNKIKIITKIDNLKLLEKTDLCYIYHLYKCNPELVEVIPRSQLDEQVQFWFHPWQEEDCPTATMSSNKALVYLKDEDVILRSRDYRKPLNYIKMCDMIFKSEYYNNIKDCIETDIVDKNKTFVVQSLYLGSDSCEDIDEYTYFVVYNEHKRDFFKMHEYIDNICDFKTFFYDSRILKKNTLIDELVN